MRFRLFLAVVAVALLTVAVGAQGTNPLVGAWERISLRDADGKPTQPPAPAAFVIFSADGFFSQTAVPPGRPKVDKPVDQMTKDELVARFNRVEARRGTYTVAGNQVTRKNVSNSNPNQEGTDQVQQFRLEGDVLILSSVDPKSKAEARFRRVK